MIYELAIVARPTLSETEINSLSKIVQDVINQFGGEILVEDNWGALTFAQIASNRENKGNFLYFIYQTGAETNLELTRRLKINEGVHKYLFCKLGPDSKKEKILKNLKIPYSKKYPGSITDLEDESDVVKDRKRFVKKKHCWFTAKNIKADWKDPKTFSWLVNEFGKIAPARISGVSYKHQRLATTAIKRARQLGIISHLSNQVAK